MLLSLKSHLCCVIKLHFNVTNSAVQKTDTQNLFCPKPYKTITKKFNAKKKGEGKEAPNNPKVY